MTKEEFLQWKKEWFLRVPKCKYFVCCHELMRCAIHPLCGCGSIFETYQIQKNPEECTAITCADCFGKHECEKVK